MTISAKNCNINFNSLVKIPVIRNDKRPAIKEWQKHTGTQVDTTYNNMGILTGEVNNLLVLDIDIKDNGMYEFNKYINEYGEPQTVKQLTPSGGAHLVFSYKHSNPRCQFLLNTYLTTRTKLRGYGLDIRSNGGFIVATPSKINNNYYTFERAFDEYPVLEIPETLINWLLVGQGEKKTKTTKPTKTLKLNKPLNNTNNINYIISDDELIKLLDMLPKTYLNNFNEWLKVLTVFKNLNKWDIFNNWSKKSKNYDNNNNITIWNNNNGVLDVNYLVFVINELNEIKHLYFSSYKPYEPITQDITNIISVDMNNKYIYDKTYTGEQLTPEIFNNYDTIILKSTTGTGKTTAVAELCKNLTNNELIVSIIDRVALANQHKLTFKEKDILLLSYLDDNKEKQLDIYTDNVVICINSFLKYQYMSIEQIKNTVLYIDEISSLLESLTHNTLLDKCLKPLMILLMKFIKHSKKVIVSDALINDNVFTLLECRSDEKKIFINNSFIKFQDVPAVRINNEYEYIDKLIDNIKINKYFFACSDSCKEITKLYYYCLNEATEEQKEHFILITSDSPYIIINASKELKNKFVFYSPSITHGIDFQPVIKQDVFYYIKASSIEPSAFFQQITRTRNINTLYYYHSESNLLMQPNKYNTIEDTINFYQNINNLTDKRNLNNMCVSVNENNEEVIIQNTFYKLYIYNEYVKDVYQTNKLKHFENIISNNGFILSEVGIKQKLSKTDNKEMTEEIINQKEIIFNEFLELEPLERRQKKYETINNHLDAFKLTDIINDDLTKIKECIQNKFYFKDILTFNKVIKNDEFIIKQKNKFDELNYNIKNYNSMYNKIHIINNICKNNDINLLSFEHKGDEINISEKEFEIYKAVFNSSKAKKPTNSEEFIKFLVNTYKLIMPSLEIIKTETTRPKEDKGPRKRQYKYNINTETINKINDILNIYGFIHAETISPNLNNEINIKCDERVRLNEETNYNNINFIDDDEAEEIINALDVGIIKYKYIERKQISPEL